MSWLVFALCGPILWAISVHLDKYLVERYFKDADVIVLLIFTALMGLVLMPLGLWVFGRIEVWAKQRGKLKRTG